MYPCTFPLISVLGRIAQIVFANIAVLSLVGIRTNILWTSHAKKLAHPFASSRRFKQFSRILREAEIYWFSSNCSITHVYLLYHSSIISEDAAQHLSAMNWACAVLSAVNATTKTQIIETTKTAVRNFHVCRVCQWCNNVKINFSDFFQDIGGQVFQSSLT